MLPTKPELTKSGIIIFAVIFSCEFIIMKLMAGNNLEINVASFIDAFALSVASSIFIYFFVAKRMLQKSMAYRSEREVEKLYLEYSLQQIEGLKKTAIVTITDRFGKIKYANANFCAISGFTVAEVVGKDHRILSSHYHPKSFFEKMWATINAGEVWRGDIRNRRKEGSYYWVDTSIIPLKTADGAINEFISIRYDITEKKDLDGLYREVIETNPEGFWLANREGRLIEVNPAYSQMTGYTRDELIGMEIKDLEANENADQIREHIEKIISKGYDRFETLHHKKDGSKIELEVSTSYLPARGGLFTVFCRDISELRKLVKLLDEEKNNARKLAETKTQFLSAMSHEIRTPLNGAIGMTRLLMDSSQDVATKTSLGVILSTCEGLSRIINEILEYTRLQAGKTQLEDENFDLRNLVESLEDLFKLPANQKGLKISFIIENSVPTGLFGDAFRIKQILTNLIGNAIKFTSSGSVTLSISLRKLDQQFAQLCFSVADTGIGIGPDCIKKLLQPFVQADSSMNRKFGGTGLGLHISESLLKLMNSHLQIESQAGEGSTFSFDINLKLAASDFKKMPKLQSAPSSLKKLFNDIIPPLNTINLIIAEDDLISQKVISGYMNLANIKYTLVKNGLECIHALQSVDGSFNGILMDIHMAEVDGIEATKRIRKFNTTIPIIALTAGVTQEEQAKCRAAGMDAILMKPFDPKNLADTISHYLINPPK